MNCPLCGSENVQRSKFCRSCGAPLDSSAEPKVTGASVPAAARSEPTPTMERTSSQALLSSRRRPGCITAYVVLFGLFAILLIIATLLSSQPQRLLDPFAAGLLLARLIVLTGLWRMKNWARIALIVVESFSLLQRAVLAITGGYSGAGWTDLAAPLFSAALSVVVIYWFATHRAPFD